MWSNFLNPPISRAAARWTRLNFSTRTPGRPTKMELQSSRRLNTKAMFCEPQFEDSFIHSGHFYSSPSSPLLLRGAPDYSTDTVSEFHAEAHRQLQVKDL